MNRILLQKLFYRIAKDSGFSMDPVDVAILGSKVLNCSALEFWIALGFENMRRIADGSLTPKWENEND
jgi:hypothetical protein